MNYEKYLVEEEKEDAASLSPENSQKVVLLSDLMDMKEQMPIMKKTIGKVLAGKPLGDKERSMIKDIMKRVMRPDKNKFRRLMKKF
jgi:hypothetical protein